MWILILEDIKCVSLLIRELSFCYQHVEINLKFMMCTSTCVIFDKVRLKSKLYQHLMRLWKSLFSSQYQFAKNIQFGVWNDFLFEINKQIKFMCCETKAFELQIINENIKFAEFHFLLLWGLKNYVGLMFVTKKWINDEILLLLTNNIANIISEATWPSTTKNISIAAAKVCNRRRSGTFNGAHSTFNILLLNSNNMTQETNKHNFHTLNTF